MGKRLAKNLATNLSKNLAKGLAGGDTEVPESLGQPLAAWWRTDEGWDGNIWTDKVAGYQADGTGHAPTTTTLNLDHTVLRFNGSSQYLSIPSAVAELFETDYTVAVAYRRRSDSSNDTIISASNGTSNDFMWMYSATTHTTTIAHKVSGAVSYASSSAVHGGYTTAIAAFTDSSNVIRYTLGLESPQSAGQPRTPVGMTSGAIGARSIGSHDSYADIDIAEICIFSGALSDADAATLNDYFNDRYDVWRKIEALPGLGYALDPRRDVDTTSGLAITDVVGGSATWSEATNNPDHLLVSSANTGCPALDFVAASGEKLTCTDSGVLAAQSGSATFTEYFACHRRIAGGATQMLSSSDLDANNWRRTYFAGASNLVVGSQRVGGTITNTAGSSIEAAGTSWWAYHEVEPIGASGLKARGSQGSESTATSASAATHTTHRLGEYATGGSHPDVEMCAYLLFTTPLSAANHTLLQSYLDDLMGL